MQTFLRAAAMILLFKYILLLWIIHTIAFIRAGHNIVSDGMLMWAPEHYVHLPPPSCVKAGLILTDGGESGRVIGSCVTHGAVNDSDMSKNQGNARSASHFTKGKNLWSVTLRWCSRSVQVSFHNSCGRLWWLLQPLNSYIYAKLPFDLASLPTTTPLPICKISNTKRIQFSARFQQMPILTVYLTLS